MYTVHVYPKNARADIELQVRDEDAVKRGDLVGWESLSSIPTHPLTGYAVEHVLPTGLSLVGGAGGVTVGFTCPGAANLVAGVDYTVVVTGQRIFVEFTEEGLRKLEAAAAQGGSAQAVSASTRSAPCRVSVSYETKVQEHLEYVLEALLYHSQAAIDSGSVEEGVTEAIAVTKWGPVEIFVHEVGKPDVPIANACFQLFASKEDAQNRTNPIVIDGVSQWITDKNGLAHIDGLRFSGFVNGFIVDADDPLFRTYYAVMTCVPDGWQGNAGPLPLIVDSAIVADVAVVELYPSEPDKPVPPGPVEPPTNPDSGGPTGESTLPKTGASVLGALLVGGIAVGLGGLLRRRREEEQEA